MYRDGTCVCLGEMLACAKHFVDSLIKLHTFMSHPSSDKIMHVHNAKLALCLGTGSHPPFCSSNRQPDKSIIHDTRACAQRANCALEACHRDMRGEGPPLYMSTLLLWFAPVVRGVVHPPARRGGCNFNHPLRAVLPFSGMRPKVSPRSSVTFVQIDSNWIPDLPRVQNTSCTSRLLAVSFMNSAAP